MRIRKNAKISSLMLSQSSGTEELQTHVCQLNQSPWDVIPFPQQSSCPPYQFEGEDSFNANGSLGDSIGAVESSVASLMEDDPEDKAAIKLKVVDNMVIVDDNYEEEETDQDNNKRTLLNNCKFKYKNSDKIKHCGYKSGGGVKSSRQLKNEAKHDGDTSMKRGEKGLAGNRRARTKGGKKGQATGSNPYEFYYYSGFGPLWGKKRGDRGQGNISKSDSEINGDDVHETTPFSSPSLVEQHYDELDFDDDDEDSENGDVGRKRMRKPVKARSLKSLM